jgi:hypothetical protein
MVQQMMLVISRLERPFFSCEAKDGIGLRKAGSNDLAVLHLNPNLPDPRVQGPQDADHELEGHGVDEEDTAVFHLGYPQRELAGLGGCVGVGSNCCCCGGDCGGVRGHFRSFLRFKFREPWKV